MLDALYGDLCKEIKNTWGLISFLILIIITTRVASLEEHNKMSPNALAIVWAPCLLRVSDDADPMESLAQLPKQTK